MNENSVNSFPELNGTLELGINDKKWFVLKTKSRCEKKIANCAFENGIEYYLPLIDSFRVYQRKKAHFLKVLIPGYLFVKCDSEEKEVLFRSGYIANFLFVANQVELVNDLKRLQEVKMVTQSSSLRNIKIPVEETGFSVVPISDWPEEGFFVEILSGPLIGLTGLVESVENADRFIIRVNVIKKAVSIALGKNQFKVLRKIKQGETIE